ncbi:MAG: hypothetical protein FJX18_02830 [Alphaproteobacteria bacterium]|nr:hypothetical protein [Alphaproteobacteria bacterium]
MDIPTFLEEFDDYSLEDGDFNYQDHLEQINFIIKASTKRKPKASAIKLTQAVIKILKQHKNPLKVREIFDALERSGYQWNFEFPLASLHNHLASLKPSSGIIRTKDNKYALVDKCSKK